MDHLHREMVSHEALCGYCVENQLQEEKRGSREMPWKAIGISYKGEMMAAWTQEVLVEATRSGQSVGMI